MSTVVGVRFKNSSKVYGFRAEGLDLKKGDTVVVDSEMGMSLGKVASMDCPVEDPGREIKPLLRKATEEDIRQDEENSALTEEARLYCNERIMARGLPMKLVATDVTLDRKRLIFYFVADNRIDFRELVKDLASKFRTRIELRQIGVRDAAALVGGIGICGREFCCRTFLKSFYPVSIKMAKQQDLVLNTAKLSGACGRLMCCLQYEYEKENERRARLAKEAEEAKAAEEERKAEEAKRAEEERIAQEARRAEEERLAQEVRRAREEREKAGEAVPAGQPAGEGPARKKSRRRRRGRGGKPRPEGAAGQPEAQRAQPSAQGGQQGAGPPEGAGGGEKKVRSKKPPWWKRKKKKQQPSQGQ